MTIRSTMWRFVVAPLTFFWLGFANDAPAADNGPSGLAGRAQTFPAVAFFPGGTGQHFEWYQYFGEHQFRPGEKAELSFVLIPFDDGGAGETLVVLDSAGGGALLGLNFHAGLVNGQLAYDRAAWNAVKVILDFESQSYAVTVNGAGASPSRFVSPSMSIQAFRLNYFGPGAGVKTRLAWLDSVLLSSADSHLLDVDFDGNLPGDEGLCRGCKLEPRQPGDNNIQPCCTNSIRPPDRHDGLAGRAETIFDFATPGQQHFEWYQFFQMRRFDSGGQVELAFFILPFAGEGAGGTLVGLDGEDGGTFWRLWFQNALVNGKLPYDTTNWNAVSASLDFANQTYKLTVNGAEMESIPFNLESRAMRAFRVNYSHPGMKPAVAWFDSVTLTSGAESLFSFDFDRTLPGAQNLCEHCRFTAADPAPEEPSQVAAPERPRLTIQRRSRGFGLSWNASDAHQVLQVSDSVLGAWRDVIEPVRLEGSTRVVEIQSATSTAFFRLVTSPTP